MVVIVIAAMLFATTVAGYAVYQWQELRRANKRVADLLAVNAEMEAEGRATRLVLSLALRQNAQLKRDNADREASLELVLEEVERLS